MEIHAVQVRDKASQDAVNTLFLRETYCIVYISHTETLVLRATDISCNGFLLCDTVQKVVAFLSENRSGT